MCGIVGYYGEKNPKDVIMDGLKALEYRGYDSAGVAIFDHGQVKRVRAEGKLVNLEVLLKNTSFDGHTGIGHTRWATHGVPSERNAHPHTVDGVSIVHNGIIENYIDIKEKLAKDGVKFTSDTDSELVAHLISREIKNTKNLLKAVFNVLPKLHGAFSIVTLWQETPNEIVAFKNGPPLLLGAGDGENIIASDLQAIVKHTKNIVYVEDNEVIHVDGVKYALYTGDGKKISRAPEKIEWTQEAAEKKGYPHFMLKEIFEQPRTVASAIQPYIDLETMSLNMGQLANTTDEMLSKQLSKFERMIIVACGTSYYAGMVAEYYLEKIAKIPVEIEFASEFRYREPIVDKNTLVLFISQSGETADTIAAMKLVKEQGVSTMSLCNVKLSTLDRATQFKMYMNCESEIGVASTKAFTSSLILLNLFSLYLGKIRGHVNADEEKKHIRALLDFPSLMEKVLAYDSFFKETAEDLKKFRGFLYIGRGVNYPIAMEGALKLKELAYMHAEGYAAGEMKHGPIALIDEKMAIVAVAPYDDVFEKTMSNVEEVAARGGKVIGIGSDQNESMKRVSQHYLTLPQAHWSLNPILAVVPLQLMAYHVSDSLGYDVDQPRNLAKSVTVE
ncbi:MAG: glutamine--fructose-6-phosphate transaminase (isomerizing) [Bdellovibrionota bacterium]